MGLSESQNRRVSMPLRGDGDPKSGRSGWAMTTFQCQYGGMETETGNDSAGNHDGFQCHYGGMETGVALQAGERTLAVSMPLRGDGDLVVPAL